MKQKTTQSRQELGNSKDPDEFSLFCLLLVLNIKGIDILFHRLSVFQMMTSSKGIEEDKNKDRHGLRYLPREKQPSMFDHLSWEHDPLKSKDWLHKMQPSYQEAKLTEPQVY